MSGRELDAGRELDMLVSEMMGGNFRPYSSDIAAADLVIDKMEEMGFSFHMRSVIPGSDAPVYIAHFGDRRKSATEFTRPLAICLAALAATEGGR